MPKPPPTSCACRRIFSAGTPVIAAKPRQHHRDALRARIDVVAVRRRVVGDDAGLGLHRVARDAVGVELEARHVRGARRTLAAVLARRRTRSRRRGCPARRRAAAARPAPALRARRRPRAAPRNPPRCAPPRRARPRARWPPPAPLPARRSARGSRASTSRCGYLERRAALAGEADHGRRVPEVPGVLAREHRDHPRLCRARAASNETISRVRAVGAQETAVQLSREDSSPRYSVPGRLPAGRPPDDP